MSATSISRLKWSAGAAIIAAMACCSLSAALAQTAPPPARVAAKPKAVAQPPQAAAAPGLTQGLAPGKTGGSEDVIARVGNSDLSAEEVRSYVAALPPREQAAIAKDPALLSQAVRLLVTNRVVLQEAIEKKWDQQPAIAAQLDRIRQRVRSAAINRLARRCEPLVLCHRSALHHRQAH